MIFPIIAKGCALDNHPWLNALQVWPLGCRPVWLDGEREVEERLADLAREVARVMGK